MAIYKSGILQAMGAEYISLTDVDDVFLEPGIHYLKDVYSVLVDGTKEEDGVEGVTKFTYDAWTIICSNTNISNQGGATPSRIQLWFPIGNSDSDSPYYISDTKSFFFIRTRNRNETSDGWGSFRMYSAGEAVRYVKSEDGFYLVNNKDFTHPEILSDRTKADKINTFKESTFAGTKYKVGEVIPTSSKFVNAQVLEVDNSGRPTKITLTDDSLTDTEGSGCTITIRMPDFSFTSGVNYSVNDIIETNDPDINAKILEVDEFGMPTDMELTESPTNKSNGGGCVVTINNSIVEIDRFGNLQESKLKSSLISPYIFNYQDSYVYELNFDDIYDNSDLAGGNSDYGFAYTPFSFENFNYSLIDKYTGKKIIGEINFNTSKHPYTPSINPGSLIWYGFVDVDGKVVTDAGQGYNNGDTFEFIVDGNTFTGTVVDASSYPIKISTDIPNGPTDILWSLSHGIYSTTTLTGNGVGLKVIITHAIQPPNYSIDPTHSNPDIPDKSLVWSGVKTLTNESMTKIGVIFIPFTIDFDMTINGVLTHIQEQGTVTVAGVYGIKPYWIASNFNTVSFNTTSAEGWSIGDNFTITIQGVKYNGEILDTSTDPYNIITDIPQNSDKSLTGQYIAVSEPEDSSKKNLVVNVNSVDSHTYKLGNSYVDPHGGYDPAFYSNSQVDILLNQLKLPNGSDWNIVAYSGIQDNRQFKELIRTTTIANDTKDRSDYKIPTESAIADWVESKLDNDVVKSLVSSWSSSGEKIHLVLSSGKDASVVTVPYASDVQDGLIKKELFTQINADHNTILSLQGLDSIAAELGENPTQAQMNKAWSDAGKGAPVEGNKIINTSEGDNQGHNWMYLNMGGVVQWYDVGSGNVAVATNEIQGVVMGTVPDTEYDYLSDIVKQTGSAINFINETLTTTISGVEDFTVDVHNTDSNGNIIAYTLKYKGKAPAQGVQEFMLSAVPFKGSHTTPLYYTNVVTVDSSAASGYINKESYTIDGITGNYSGYVINSFVNPIECITNIPVKTSTDITGIYNTTSTNGSGSGLKVKVVSTPYFENVDFRLNITSWTLPSNTVQITDLDGHMAVQGVSTLADQVTFLRENKADKKEITITSSDSSIVIDKPEGFENDPKFDLKFNLAGSTQWVTLTGLIDGITDSWDLTNYFTGLSTSNVEFYYGDGILIPGVDYTFTSSVIINQGGAGYEVGQVVMLDNDAQRYAKVTGVGISGEILTAEITTALATPTDGTGASLSAQFLFKSLKEPYMNSANNRTFMAKAVKLALISELSGVTAVVDPTNTINCGVQDNTATIGLNVQAVFRANSAQPCYINLTTPSPTMGILTQGSLVGLLQQLTNNMDYVMKNAVWKYNTNANRVEIAVQDDAVTPKANTDIIRIRPADLGQDVNPAE